MTYHDFAVDLVRRAGGRVKKAHTETLTILYKENDPRNPVTAVDIEVSKFLTTEILKAFPDHRVYSEEDEEEKELTFRGFEWVLDPIEGTGNFSHHIPHFAVVAGLLRDGTPIAGAIYNPITNELFSFEEGKAYLNGKLIVVSSVTEPKDAQSIIVIGHREPLFDWGAALYRSFLEHVNKNKGFGSAALDLAFLAAGRADIVVYGTYSLPDGIIGVAMVRAAGGEVYAIETGEPVSLSPGRYTVVATANRELFQKIQPLLHADLLRA
jgi:myo-inositol-1(or 4)-monophosphatase